MTVNAALGLLRPPVPAELTPDDLWDAYAVEVFAHAGMPAVDVTDLDALPPIVVVSRAPSLEAVDALSDWVRAGGQLLVVGDPGPLAGMAGVSVGESRTDGHVVWAADAEWLPEPTGGVHAWGGVTLRLEGAAPVAHWTDVRGGVGDVAATVQRVGAGQIVVIGVDAWQSIVRIQQGFPIYGNGRPAADGTAPFDDDILRCEDGLALSFERDRGMAPGVAPFAEPFEYDHPPTAAAPVFDRPHADIWREVIIGAVSWLAEQAEVVLPWLFYWPAGVEAVAHMSHDSDGNADPMAAAALDAFADADVRVTWCVLHPGGYGPGTYRAIAAAGHETAFHYNAMGDTDLDVWGEQQFKEQLDWLRDTTGVDRVVTNKNHYTRWEGWADFYGWCERAGIQIDQSRGPSKQGVIGFPFGSCHLGFPMAGPDEGGRLFDVLMMPLHAQDLWWTGVVENREVILSGALEHNGVAHFLFHGRNMLRHPEIADAIRSTAELARGRGIPWWTSEQLNAWERTRRSVRIEASWPDPDVLRLDVTSEAAIDPAAIVLPGLDVRRTWIADEGTVRIATRNGRAVVELACTMPAGATTLTVRAG